MVNLLILLNLIMKQLHFLVINNNYKLNHIEFQELQSATQDYHIIIYKHRTTTINHHLEILDYLEIMNQTEQ